MLVKLSIGRKVYDRRKPERIGVFNGWQRDGRFAIVKFPCEAAVKVVAREIRKVIER